MNPSDPRLPDPASPEPSLGPDVALRVDRALQGWSDAEAREARLRLGGPAPAQAHDDFELAAAQLDLALFPPTSTPLSPALRERLIRDAEPYLAPRRPFARRAMVWAAAALLLIAAIAGWWPTRPSAPSRDLDRLLASGLQLSTLPWTVPGKSTPAGSHGEVVWSPDRQEGYLRIAGLAANDPTREQYQLWIFDADRPSETPVDGGVFDLRGPTDVVPIRAALPVGRAVAFAVTVERPGGVVVSKRERVALLAQAP